MIRFSSGVKVASPSRWSFLVNGYGLGPLKIYRIRTHHSTHIIKNLAVGYGLSAHIYQFNDGNGHGTYGIDGGISYRDQLLSVILAGFDLNRPGLTNQDQITPRFSFAIAIGQNPSIQFQLHHEGFLSIYTGFSMPLSRVLSISSGYQNNPREISFAIALSLKPCLTYAGSLHEILGLSHRVGARL